MEVLARSGRLSFDEPSNLLMVPVTRWLTSRGLCSRKQAKRWITGGRVVVDGHVATFTTDVHVAPLPHATVQVWMDPVEIHHRRSQLPHHHSRLGGEVEEGAEAEAMLQLVTVSDAVAVSAAPPTGNTGVLADERGQVAPGEKELMYLLYHKPRGVECTTDPRIPCSWVNLIDRPGFPSHVKHQLISVGRLDKDSEGLLLLTNDGSIVNPLMQSVGGFEKEYEVLLNRPFARNGPFIERMRKGEAIRRGTVPISPPVFVEAITTQKDRTSFRGEDEERLLNSASPNLNQLESSAIGGVEDTEEAPKKRKWEDVRELERPDATDKKRKTEEMTESSRWLRIVLREGKNRQIRRMVRQCSDRHLIVRRLVRVRLGHLTMAGLTTPGSWRHLQPEEVAVIKEREDPRKGMRSHG